MNYQSSLLSKNLRGGSYSASLLSNWRITSTNLTSLFGKTAEPQNSAENFLFPFSILINMISYKNSWSYQSFYYIYRVFKMILEWYERFWNKAEVITFPCINSKLSTSFSVNVKVCSNKLLQFSIEQAS